MPTITTTPETARNASAHQVQLAELAEIEARRFIVRDAGAERSAETMMAHVHTLAAAEARHLFWGEASSAAGWQLSAKPLAPLAEMSELLRNVAIATLTRSSDDTRSGRGNDLKRVQADARRAAASELLAIVSRW